MKKCWHLNKSKSTRRTESKDHLEEGERQREDDIAYLKSNLTDETIVNTTTTAKEARRTQKQE